MTFILYLMHTWKAQQNDPDIKKELKKDEKKDDKKDDKKKTKDEEKDPVHASTDTK